MSSPALKIVEGVKEKKRIKTKIRVKSFVKEKFGDMEDNTREEGSRRMRQEVEGRVKYVVGKKRLLVQFEDGKNKDTSYCLLMFLSSKDEVDMDEPLSNSPEKEQGELLIIYGDPEVREPCMFQRGMYFSVFYCLCYVKEI